LSYATLAGCDVSSLTLVTESFDKVITDDRISEIIIVDDFSSIEIFNDLKNRIDNLKNSKIKLETNPSK
jgi:hypothetical protein